MFARGISSFTRTWMNLGCQKRLQSTSATTYPNPNPNIDIEARDEIHHPRSNARGMPGGGGCCSFDLTGTLYSYGFFTVC